MAELPYNPFWWARKRMIKSAYILSIIYRNDALLYGW